MDLGESSERQRGNARDAGGRRQIVLDVDLNIAPRRELMDLNEQPDIVEGEGSGNARGQAVPDGAVAGDDDVEIISPSTFKEATRNSRRVRNHAATEVTYEEDGFLLSELQSTNPREETDLGMDLATDALLPPPEEPESNSEPEPSPTCICGICRNQLVEETSTKCGHIFCKDCIHAALAIRRECPTCRKRLRRTDTFRVYLPKLS
ncbi:hypothetical protein TIFTF001_031968 [Ficus carica]|uniref:RING-type domain-containing protein n=1 Tax=Ficus carica TaxID=3494 RepID=A0AA88DXJ4_FICCA|nr:hypothetical protein TIFTF001_031968 [Ficus carica]